MQNKWPRSVIQRAVSLTQKHIKAKSMCEICARKSWLVTESDSAIDKQNDECFFGPLEKSRQPSGWGCWNGSLEAARRLMSTNNSNWAPLRLRAVWLKCFFVSDVFYVCLLCFLVWDDDLSDCLPSGKLSHNYGKSQFLMGKLTIDGHFQ